MARYTSYRKRKKRKALSTFLTVLLTIFVAGYLLAALSEKQGLDYIPTLSEIKAFFNREEEAAPGDYEVHFIDVGQGDCSLILSEGSVILIDAGENDQGKVVVDYLKKLGIEKIDLLMMTHPHSDHIGGMDNVIRSFEIGKIVMPKLPDSQVPATKTYTDVLTAIAEKSLKITPAKPGTEYLFGGGKITLLGPVAEYEELNNTSLVCRFSGGGTSFLFTGDMEKTAEGDLLEVGTDLHADVLKLGHHGSSTSTSKRFYRAVMPKYCMIPVGDGNSYGHPSEATLDTIRGNGNAKIYRNDYQGTVVFRISDGVLRVETEKGNKQ